MRLRSSLIALTLMWLTVAFATPAHADRVSALSALHHDGQTFLTWTSPPGVGWTYRIYASRTCMESVTDLATSDLIGEVGDSTWCDKRLTGLMGKLHTYAIDSLATPLNDRHGLFVVTPRQTGYSYYAVTAKRIWYEDRNLVPGVNTLTAPVRETLAEIRPVYQGKVERNGSTIEVYTLWTTDTETPLTPAMSNRASVPFDCGIVRGGIGPTDPLMIRPHPFGQNFLSVANSSGEPDEWRLTLDDPLTTSEAHTWWYGYHEGYDLTSGSQEPPTGGTVSDYTFRRIEHTVEWALATFPIDRTRVYASGYSMGGIGSLWLAMRRPDLIAAVMAVVPKFDFSFQGDPDPRSLWSPTGGFRRKTEKLWGKVEQNLPSTDGMPVYDRLNMGVLAARMESKGMPPIVAYSGRDDYVVGWAEKIPFYRSMETHRHGGHFFWDERGHTSVGAWSGLEDARYLYRYKSDRSYPALSRCSADSDPGDGDPTVGDRIGSINGFVEWDVEPLDEPQTWQTTLRLVNLKASHALAVAPAWVTVDVTPRRLQKFVVDPSASYRYTVRRLVDGAEIQSGVLTVDGSGLLTVPQVRVERGGCELRIEASPTLGIGFEPPTRSLRPLLELARNPVTGPLNGAVAWASLDAGQLELFDVSGRLVRSQAVVAPGAGLAPFTLDTTGLSNGIYFLAARQAGLVGVKKVTIAR